MSVDSKLPEDRLCLLYSSSFPQCLTHCLVCIRFMNIGGVLLLLLAFPPPFQAHQHLLHAFSFVMFQKLFFHLHLFWGAGVGVLLYGPAWSALGTVLAHCNLHLPISSNFPASASLVAGTTGLHDHTQLIFVFLVDRVLPCRPGWS